MKVVFSTLKKTVLASGFALLAVANTASAYAYSEFDQAQLDAIYEQAYQQAQDEQAAELIARLEEIDAYYEQMLEDGEVGAEELAAIQEQLEALEALDDELTDVALADAIEQYEAMLLAGIEYGFIH